MDKSINEKLLEVQKDWVNGPLQTYWNDLLKDSTDKSCVDKDKRLSHPFYFGLTEEYICRSDGRKRLMIVGQEAMGYGSICDGTAEYEFVKSCTPKLCEKGTNEPNYSQKWAIAYLEKQINGKNGRFEINTNPSPFWQLCRELNKNFVLCWNNLDKVYFIETGELTEKAEEKLSAPYEKDGQKKSLLLREIDFVESDAILFVTGPTYYKSMIYALCSANDELSNNKPTRGNKLSDITDILNLNTKSGKKIPVYWTYHPNYLNHISAMKEIVDIITYKICNGK